MEAAEQEQLRPRSAVLPPTQFLSPVDPTLESYAFPPAPRSASLLGTFNSLKPASTVIVDSPRVTDPEPQLSPRPPLLAQFLSPEAAPTRDEPVEPSMSRSRPVQERAATQANGQLCAESPRFSSLGQAIYNGNDAREVLSSFSFAKLLNPPEAEVSPSSPRRRRAEYGQSISYAGPSPPLVPISSQSRSRVSRPSIVTTSTSWSARPHYSFPSPVVTPRRLDSNQHSPAVVRRRDLAKIVTPRATGSVRNLLNSPRLGSPIRLAPPCGLATNSYPRSTCSPSQPRVDPSRHSTSSTFSSAPNPLSNHKRTSESLATAKSRSVVGLYRPSPQSMLAPEAVRDVAISLPPLTSSVRARPGGKRSRGARAEEGGGGGGVASRAWNAPAIDPNLDFDSLPTKNSRGRKPLTVPELALQETGATSGRGEGERGGNVVVVRGNGDDDARIVEAYAGTEKNGKAKRVWLCKVKDCGKVFKRGEHLQRHVRSIHTGEKPFQCQWTGCGKYFSRHDNLNQHLRVHRKPGQSVEEFSAQLEACFNRRLRQVEQESAEYKRQAQEAALAEERRARAAAAAAEWEGEGEGEGEAERGRQEAEEESIYAPPTEKAKGPIDRDDWRGPPAAKRRKRMSAATRDYSGTRSPESEGEGGRGSVRTA